MPVELARLEAIFSEALAKSTPGERVAFLDQACGSDMELRGRIESLLASHEDAGSFMVPPDPDRTIESHIPIHEKPGSKIGRYKLLEQIGEGGFGVVFMAEQEQPVRRRVALKIIKLGMDTKQVVARFEAERQALAMMDHPNIAKVFDGGSTDSGRPYFVMELVKGRPITGYCDEEKLDLRQRLELFQDVSHAVQHAHTKGSIHRDIKPSNVMVSRHDDKPVVKVIDFGIAKATAGRLTDKTLFTEFHQLIGTPAYMSPEQAGLSDLDIDTRSDVYSLGVLLYELLAGTTPFDSRRLSIVGYDEMRRIIREEQPPRPSTRVATSKSQKVKTPKPQVASGPRLPLTSPFDDKGAGQRNGATKSSSVVAQPESLGDSSSIDEIARFRRTDAWTLQRRLRGDLDTIVMKCMEKDRARRYEGASALAADIRHYLADEPIEAKRDSGLYVLRKSLNRHRAALVSSAAVLLALLAGTVVSTQMYFRERHARNSERLQREIAERNEKSSRAEAEKSTAALSFLRQMMESANPRTREGGGTPIREVMDKTVGRLDSGELSGQPEVEAHVRTAIGSAYRAMGLFSESEAQLQASLRIRRQVFGAEHETVGDSLYELAVTFEEWGRIAQSEPLYRESLQIFREFLPANDDRIALNTNDLANVLRKLGRPDESEVLFRRALEMSEDKFGEESREAGRYSNNLANVLRLQGRLEEAEWLYRRSISLQSAGKTDTTVDSSYPLLGLAATMHEQGDLAQAESLATQHMRILEESLGGDHAFCAYPLNVLGRILQDQGRLEEAETLLRRALDIRRQTLLRASPDLATSLDGLGVFLLRADRPADAEPLLRECLSILLASLPSGHERIAESQAALGACLTALHRYSESESLLLSGHEGLAAAAEKFPSPWRIQAVRQACESLCKSYEARGMPEKATEWRAKLEARPVEPSR